MASYDLKCVTCGKDFEVFCLGFLKDEVKVCPECGGRDVQQRFTGFGGCHRPCLRRLPRHGTLPAQQRLLAEVRASAERTRHGARAAPLHAIMRRNAALFERARLGYSEV